MATRLAVIIAACLFVLLVLDVAGSTLVSPGEAVPVATGEKVDQVANALAAVDQAVSMLFAVAIGMFAVVGLLLKDVGPTIRPAEVLAPCLFFATSAAGIYFGFMARLDAVHSANFSIAPMQDVQRLLGWQGTFVAFSAAILVVVCYDLLIARKLGQPR